MSKKNKQYVFQSQAVCHEGNVLVGTAGAISIYGGGHSRDCDIASVDLVFDLAHSPSSTTLFQMNSAALNNPVFERLRRETPVISITWPDYSVPAVSRRRWAEIVEAIHAFAEVPVDILFCCQGGHGRTGTALAIICSLLNIIPENEDPVKWVREKYCKKAVESNEQLNYIELITGRLTKEEAYKEQFLQPPSLQSITPFIKGGENLQSAQQEVKDIQPWYYND
jgi:protein-tyrosine phosphatase